MDTLSRVERSERMARIKHKGSKPEMLVRRLVHALGYRFRLHRKGLPGSPDLVLPRHKKVILVHGCFWHRHPDPACKFARLPKSRLEFWEPKLETNAKRDRAQLDALLALGWMTMVVWECETRDSEHLKNRLRAFLGGSTI